MDNKSKILHFCVFGCKAYVFLFNKIYANKLVPYSELIIYAIFDEEFFSKYIDSHAKEYNLYNTLLDKISLETELSVSREPAGSIVFM